MVSPGAQKAARVFQAMEGLRIRNKAGDLVPFIFNAAQLRLARYVAMCWHLGRPVRALVPKYRQGGITTWWRALAFVLCLFATEAGQAYRVGLVAHDDDGGETIFQITREFQKNLPPALDGEFTPKFRLENFNLAGIRWASRSEDQVYSVKKLDALGKGGTINFLHLTEAASYGDKGVDAEVAINSIKGALVKEEATQPDSVVVYESTANGHDSFFWPQVEASFKGESDYVVMFLPWFLEPTYSMTWARYRAMVLANPQNADPGARFEPTDDERLLRAALAQPVSPEEEHYRYQHWLTDEQLIWRRSVIRDLGGRLRDFQRYYPATIEEAFQASERCAFAQDTIEHYLGAARDADDQGDVDLKNPSKATEWRASRHGKLRVWEHPRQGDEYLIAADVSEGTGGDFSCAYVFHRDTTTIVAAMHGQWEWEDYARALEAVAYYYNAAELVVEANVSRTSAAGAQVAAWLHRQGYRGLYYYREEDRLDPTSPGKPGWNTNDKTRSQALTALYEACRARRLASYDRRLASEMRTFVLNEKRKRYEAAPGKNDDAVLAAAIGCFLLQPSGQRPRGLVTTPSQDPVLAELARMRETYERTQRAAGFGQFRFL